MTLATMANLQKENKRGLAGHLDRFQSVSYGSRGRISLRTGSIVCTKEKQQSEGRAIPNAWRDLFHESLGLELLAAEVPKTILPRVVQFYTMQN